jgi:hypothetical protein
MRSMSNVPSNESKTVEMLSRDFHGELPPLLPLLPLRDSANHSAPMPSRVGAFFIDLSQSPAFRRLL